MHRYCSVVVLLLGAVQFSQSAGFPHVIPNGLNFLGIGYNIIDGNPEGGDLITGGIDPGLLVTRRIMSFTYNDSRRTSDIQYSVPDQAIYVARSSAVATTTATTFHGVQSYTHKLLQQIRISAGWTFNFEDIFMNMEFSASNRYEEIQKKTSTFGYIYYANETVQNLGRARYLTEMAGQRSFPLSDEFVVDACKLPNTYNTSTYMEFLDTWGTHIVTDVDLGIRSGSHYQANRSSFLEYVSKEADASMKSKLNFGLFRSSVEVDMSLFNTGMTSKTFFGMKSASYTIGSKAMHEPIGLGLLSIDGIFREDFWKLFKVYVKNGLCSSTWNLTTISKNVLTASQNYIWWRKKFPTLDPPVVVPVTWPVGQYALPKPQAGCPNYQFAWAEGWRSEATSQVPATNSYSNPLHLAGWVSKGWIKQEFCVKTALRTGDFDWTWPVGTYCIYQYGPSCPSGFQSGSILRTDIQSNNNNSVAGAVPFGEYGINTKHFFCCREDGPTNQQINMPTDNVFFLFSRFGQCQKISGMRSTTEWLYWDTLDGKNNKDAFEQPFPYLGRVGTHGVKIYYCYYEPTP